jgi:MoxR-like ATPase
MFDDVKKYIGQNIVGNESNLRNSLAAVLCGGHILIEDLPGTGKTTFAKWLTASLNLDFKRIQFTSDLLPSDILGFSFLSKDKFEIKKGPIFSNIILADELNRASPKTQSAFLEAMEEKSVTIDRETFQLPDPFIVIATQNPSDLSGTSLLPESQLDRFMISFSLDELTNEQQLNLLKNHDLTNVDNRSEINFKDLKPNDNININDNVYKYIQNIKKFIDNNFPEIHISTRCLKQIVSLAKSLTLLNGKDYLTFQDIKDIIPYILKHRIKIVEKTKVLDFINDEILDKVSLPDDK